VKIITLGSARFSFQTFTGIDFETSFSFDQNNGEPMAKIREMVIHHAWFQVSILTFIIGFTILAVLAYLIYNENPPVPEKVVDENGKVIYTREDVIKGQNLFQRRGFMEYGTIFGHGAYLGPDFTAQYLHEEALSIIDAFKSEGMDDADAKAKTKNELKTNTFDQTTSILVYSKERASFFKEKRNYFAKWATSTEKQKGLKRPYISDPKEIHYLTSFISWASWTTAVKRPGKDYSFTNNWPPETLAGNTPTSEAFIWSVYSLIALLGGTGLVFFFFGHYNILGWHRQNENFTKPLSFIKPEDVRLAPVQKATVWYFIVVVSLFLAQGLLGGLNAHYHVSQASFYGFDIAKYIPYNLSRTWHLQLAIFFVATSFLAMGLFITPLINPFQPKYQGTLAALLFFALAFVVVGSLIGEAASYHGIISAKGAWFWFGTQGWEYLDLGRFWQILLTIGMFLWLIILVRGIKPSLQNESTGNIPYLLLYSSFTIPAFYAVGMLFGKQTHFAVMDFWRFWVVHLWVEDFLELFTTIMVAYIFVLLGIVHEKVATRVVYFDIILYSIGGVVGTMHHLYFSGAPAAHMAFGAFFSAMEVIPLLLLTIEGWRFMELGRNDENSKRYRGRFPHYWAVLFLVAVGFWNFLGAGIFGFLINLPIVSYYEIGTGLTANHAHGAMMGVYGMLAIAFFMFVSRYFVPSDSHSETARKLSFWGLNAGLFWMVFSNLFPLGALQLIDSFQTGYWHARRQEFFAQPFVNAIEWLRFPGDLIFIIVGIFPVCYLALRMVKHRNRVGTIEPGKPLLLTVSENE
jgi:nitric oxide reductase subunit B